MSTAGCHFSTCPVPSGMRARPRRRAARSGSSARAGSHCLGRNSRQFTGHEAVSVTRCTLGATWQLAVLPNAPQYCAATPGEAWPSSGKDTSSITQAAGRMSGSMRQASSASTI